MQDKRIIQAAYFAAEKHRTQRRKDTEKTPYINHPLALANVLSVECSIDDVEVICGALLHDTIEDTNASKEELLENFGENITRIVLEVTDDKTLDKIERKEAQVAHAPHISDQAKLVKLADKISNLRDISASPPIGWSVERKQEYFDWAARVIDGLRGIHPGLEALFDQIYSKRP
jgi:GTP diphosphokinase / guanosine-3',5'-bis(diphosphate) 3'-diphosphatase